MTNNNYTRHHNNLHIPQTNTDAGARSLLVRGAKLWNKLPPEITSSNSLPTFKNNLHNVLL